MAKTSKKIPVAKKRLQRINTDRMWLKNSKIFMACQKIIPYSHPSDVIKYLRVGEGLTLDQTAERLGVNKSTVSRWTPPEIVGLQHFTATARQSACRCIKQIHARRRQEEINRNAINT